jgi:hypothetical protein
VTANKQVELFYLGNVVVAPALLAIVAYSQAASQTVCKHRQYVLLGSSSSANRATVQTDSASPIASTRYPRGRACRRGGTQAFGCADTRRKA